MIIQLTGDRRLSSDSHQYTLDKRRVVKGEVVWRSYKFYGSLGAAVKAVPEQLLKESSAEGLHEVLLFLRTLERKLLCMLGEQVK